MFALAVVPALGQAFQPLDFQVQPLQWGDAAWADFDDDGDLDLLHVGQAKGGWPITILLRNDSARFERVNTSLPHVSHGAIAWGDFDNDGRIDILLSGKDGPTRLYRNEGAGNFSPVAQEFGEVDCTLADGVCGIRWADLNGDGSLDLLMFGSGSVRAFVNRGGVFTRYNSESIYGSGVVPLFYDDDDMLDLVVVGMGEAGVYRNTGSGFELADALSPVDIASAAILDLDNDGRPDLVYAGRDAAPSLLASVHVYRGTESGFERLETDLATIDYGKVIAADFDRDGKADLLLGGTKLHSGDFTVLYRSEGSAFSSTPLGVRAGALDNAAWADFDGDGDVDLFLSTTYSGPLGQPRDTTRAWILRNELNPPRMPVQPPNNLRAEAQTPGYAVLGWDPPDVPATFNVRIGTEPGAIDVVSPMSHIGGSLDGRRKVVGYGNAGFRSRFRINGLEPGTTYYWSVQAIDYAYNGSVFSPESSFTTATDSQFDRHETDETEWFTVYPNPATTFATVAFGLSQPGMIQFEVYDLLGRRVRVGDSYYVSGGEQRQRLETGHLPVGLYLVRLVTDDGALTARLVKR